MAHALTALRTSAHDHSPKTAQITVTVSVSLWRWTADFMNSEKFSWIQLLAQTVQQTAVMTYRLEFTVGNISSASATLARNSEFLISYTRFITVLTQVKLINVPVLFRVQICNDPSGSAAWQISIHSKTAEHHALLTSVNLAYLQTADRLSWWPCALPTCGNEWGNMKLI